MGVAIVFLLMLLLPSCVLDKPVSHMANPAAVYCGQQGGQSFIRRDTAGNEAGYCRLANGSQCDEWAFYRHECGHVLFGLSDERGDRVIATEAIARPGNFQSAIARGGQVVHLRFAGRQQEAEDYDGRQLSNRFSKMGGEVFNVRERIAHKGVCVILRAGFLKRIDLVSLTHPSSAALPDGVKQRLVQKLGGRLIRTRVLAESADGLAIASVLARTGKGNVAGLALVEGGRLLFHEFPASSGGLDRWRADDGGRFSGTIEVLFAYRRGRELGFAFSWHAAEGEYLEALESRGLSFLSIGKGYLYQSAM